LEGNKKALERNHTSTLSTVNNLGNLYEHQSKFVHAAALCGIARRGGRTEQDLSRDAVQVGEPFAATRDMSFE
jgi:hypothetical protein